MPCEQTWLKTSISFCWRSKNLFAVRTGTTRQAHIAKFLHKMSPRQAQCFLSEVSPRWCFGRDMMAKLLPAASTQLLCKLTSTPSVVLFMPQAQHKALNINP